MMRKIQVYIILSLQIFGFVACSSFQSMQTSHADHTLAVLDDAQHPSNANYLDLNCSLKSIELNSTDAYAISSLYRNFSLKLNQNLSFSGNALCNNYFGSYIVDGYKVKFSSLSMTRKACGSNLENEISKIFQLINNYSIDSKHLFLKNNNDVLIVLKIE